MPDIGITGTRNGLNDLQRKWLILHLDGAQVGTLHHGGCLGVDRESHFLALERGIPVVVHPPTNQRLAALDTLIPSELVTVLPAKDYHSRDRDIVDAADILLGLPDGPRRPHSGTWYTIGYAESVHTPFRVCLPEGPIA